MKDKHLVIGASGQIGNHILSYLKSRNQQVIGTYRSFKVDGLSRLDACNKDDVKKIIMDIRPSYIYVSAHSGVVESNTSPERSYQNNVGIVVNVCETISGTGTKLICFSTDYVFDGERSDYNENDPPNPINIYGRQKLEMEQYVHANVEEYMIVRTSVVYSAELQKRNFICRLIDTIRSGNSMNVVTDQFAAPTYALDIARAVYDLNRIRYSGLIHICGPQVISRYELALKTADVFLLDKKLIKQATLQSLRDKISRPKNTGLSTNKMFDMLGYRLSNPENGLMKMKEMLESPAYRS